MRHIVIIRIIDKRPFQYYLTSEVKKMVVEIRSKWGSKAEFVLAIVGYGVGLGNIWRFPYLCYRSGGGGFLVPYLIMLFFSGIPLFYLEAALGQFSSSAIITIFEKLAPALKGCAYAAIVVNIIASMQYNLLVSLVCVLTQKYSKLIISPIFIDFISNFVLS